MSTEKEFIEPSARTKSHVERALEAFEIPLSSIRIYGFKQSGNAISTGLANSATKMIALNENISELDSVSTSFHEAAHIKDDISNKIKIYAKWLTGAALIPYIALFPRSTQYIERMFISRLVQTIFCASYGIIGSSLGFWFYYNAAIPWAIEQGEYRADKMSIEKMLSLNELDPILTRLMNKQILKRNHRHKRIFGHPSAGAEYKAMKTTLQNNGYEVIKSHPGGSTNILEISVTKNGNGRLIQRRINDKV